MRTSSVAFFRNLNLGQRRSHSPTRPEPLPWTPARGGLTVVRADGRHAVSVNDVERTSGATWVLERLLAVPVTSRGVRTMVRLAAKLA